MNRGMSILEVLIVASIILIVVLGISDAWRLYIRAATNVSMQTQATLLSQEIYTALNVLRDNSWNTNINSLSLDTNYYLQWNGNGYISTVTPVLISSTTQDTLIGRIVFKSVNRDVSSNIVSSGGSLDANTRLASIYIYPVGSTTNTILKSDMLIHNVYNN